MTNRCSRLKATGGDSGMVTPKRSVNVDQLAVFAALLSTGATLVSAFGEAETPFLVQSRAGILLLFLWTVVCIPVAFWLPRVQTGLLGRMAGWHVPSHTYLIPRWLVRLCIGCLVGQFIGVILWALLNDLRVLWFASSIVVLGAAFLAGAWRRLTELPCTEFTMPLPGWHLWQKALGTFFRSARADTPSEYVDATE